MTFDPILLKNLWKPGSELTGEEHGQVVVIGGSRLFHGAPILSLTAASRTVGMVFFASPEPDMKLMSVELKSRLSGFIWVPWDQIGAYIEQSDAVLIGPGFMRYGEEDTDTDSTAIYTRETTKRLLEQFPNKQWVIDAGSLQVMQPEWIPKNAIVTPNMKEFQMLFGEAFSGKAVEEMAAKYHCVVVGKNEVTHVSDGKMSYEILGGNKGLEKGGVGDTLAGMILGLVAKNPPILAAAAGSFIVKKTAERLFEKVGYGFNADDLAGAVFETKKLLVGF